MSTLQYIPVALPAEPQPEWHVYGFNEGDMLIVSTRSTLRWHNYNLLLNRCPKKDEWKDNLKAAHQQVLDIGGYATYAAFVQAAIDKLVENTVGDTTDDQAVTGAAHAQHPEPYKLDAFYISAPPGSKTYSTILPAVRYPVVQIPAFDYKTGEGEGFWQYVLDESPPAQTSRNHHQLVCAGPRLIKIGRLIHKQGGHLEYKTDWPTAYSQWVMKKDCLADNALGFNREARKSIPLSMRHGKVYIWAEVWPAGTPDTTCLGLDGTFWHPQQTGHFHPALPKVVDWSLKIKSVQDEQVLKSFKTRLKFEIKFPRLDWLKQYFVQEAPHMFRRH